MYYHLFKTSFAGWAKHFLHFLLLPFLKNYISEEFFCHSLGYLLWSSFCPVTSKTDQKKVSRCILLIIFIFSGILFLETPKFGNLMKNITVTVGRDAVLTCVVENLSIFKVISKLILRQFQVLFSKFSTILIQLVDHLIIQFLDSSSKAD